MSLKSKVDKLEKQLKLSDIPDADLEGCFPGWTKEELANYAINGIEPEGKGIGPISDRAYNNSLCERFDGWTKEDLTRYVLTGEKPQKESRL